jgi:RNA polymerase primary sigma factor
LDRVIGEGGAVLGDLIAADDPSIEDAAADSELREQIEIALARMTERERTVIELRFGLLGESQTLEEIGRRLGVTRERVRQLETQALKHLAHLPGIAAYRGAFGVSKGQAS